MSSPGLTLPSLGLSEPSPSSESLAQSSQSLAQSFQSLDLASQRLAQPSQSLSQACQMLTDGWMDGRTDSPCVLQDFVPFGSAALLTSKADSQKCHSRARVPLTTSCLWATGCEYSHKRRSEQLLLPNVPVDPQRERKKSIMVKNGRGVSFRRHQFHSSFFHRK